MCALTKQRGATTVVRMGNPEDELVDLLGDKPDGVVEISEHVAPRRLGVLEDVVVANASPSAAEFAVDLDEFERGATIWACERPGHLEDARGALD